MNKYLKEALLLRTSVPVFGSLPVNVLLVLGFLMLGFGHPGFWLLGLGLETVLIYGLTTNKRFRRWVDTRHAVATDEEFAVQWRDLCNQIGYDKQQRLNALQSKCDQILQKYRQAKAAEYLIESNHHTLRQLTWLYLKLLIGQTNLENLGRQSNELEIKQQKEQLERDLLDQSLLPSVRESKEATLQIVLKRLENINRRETSLREIESDLHRIDAQTDLALENATLQDQPQDISANIDLYSQALDSNIFGESAAVIENLDRSIIRQ